MFSHLFKDLLRRRWMVYVSAVMVYGLIPLFGSELGQLLLLWCLFFYGPAAVRLLEMQTARAYSSLPISREALGRLVWFEWAVFFPALLCFLQIFITIPLWSKNDVASLGLEFITAAHMSPSRVVAFFILIAGANATLLLLWFTHGRGLRGGFLNSLYCLGLLVPSALVVALYSLFIARWTPAGQIDLGHDFVWPGLTETSNSLNTFLDELGTAGGAAILAVALGTVCLAWLVAPRFGRYPQYANVTSVNRAFGNREPSAHYAPSRVGALSPWMNVSENVLRMLMAGAASAATLMGVFWFVAPVFFEHAPQGQWAYIVLALAPPLIMIFALFAVPWLTTLRALRALPLAPRSTTLLLMSLPVTAVTVCALFFIAVLLLLGKPAATLAILPALPVAAGLAYCASALMLRFGFEKGLLTYVALFFIISVASVGFFDSAINPLDDYFSVINTPTLSTLLPFYAVAIIVAFLLWTFGYLAIRRIVWKSSVPYRLATDLFAQYQNKSPI